MALDAFANFAKSTLASGITSGATSLTVATGDGTRFPAVSFNAVIWNQTDYTSPSDDPDREIVRVTGIATDTFTIIRGQENTSAVAHNTGGKTYGIHAGATAKTFNNDIGGKTQGSVLFAGADGGPSQDNTNFFWDDTNNRLGVGINSSLLASFHSQTSSIITGFRHVNTAALGAGSGGGYTALTSAHPTASGQRVGGIFVGSTESGTDYLPAAVVAYSREAWTSTNRGSYLEFQVTNLGSTARASVGRADTSGIHANFLDAGGFVRNVRSNTYGAVAGAIYKTASGAIDSGTPTLTVTGGSFTASDVGKLCYVQGAGAAGAVLATTISGFTSSTVVTLANNASTTVSSKDVLYGTDDTAAFQAAIDAGAGTVVVPGGNYIVSQLALKTNVWLWGAGWNAQIYQKGAFSGHLIIQNDASVIHAGVYNITLNGTKNVQSAANNIIHFAEATTAGDDIHTIYNCFITSAKNSGIYLGNQVRETRVYGCYVYDCDGIGIHFDTGATDNSMVQVDVGLAGLQGIKLVGGNNRLTNVKSFYSGQINSALGYGFHNVGSNNEFGSCEAQDNLSHGYYFDGATNAAAVNATTDSNQGDCYRLSASTDCRLHGQVLDSGRADQTAIVNLINSSVRNRIDITFPVGAVAAGTAYVQGTTTGNDIKVGPDGGYQTPSFPGTRTWTVVAATDIITASSAHNLNANEPVYVSNSGGALPASTPQIVANTIYYVRDITSTTFKLSTTPGGAAIDFTGTGTGTQTVQLPLQPNPYNGNVFAVTLTGDMPIALPVQQHQGQRMSFQLLQDGTGGRKTGFSSAYSTLEFLPRTSANRLNIVEFIYNGTTWVQSGGLFSASQSSRLPADATTTSTSAVDVADASSNKLQFQIGDSEVWSFEFNLRTGSSSAAGLKFAITFPSGGTMLAQAVGTTTGVTVFSSDIMTASGTLGIAYNTVNAQTGNLRITGVLVNGSTDGNVTLQFAKVTSGTATVAANAYLNARRIS